MGTSPDVGGRTGIGRPLVPEYSELEATAQTQVARQGLAIVPSTIEVVFTQIGGNVWHYEASAPKPSLPLFVLTAPTHAETEKTPPEVLEAYEALRKQLSLKLGTELEKELRKHPSERDPSYVVLDNLLKFAARALVWLREVETITPEQFATNTAKQAALPIFALQGWVEHARESLLTLSESVKRHGLPNRVAKENEQLLQPLIDLALSYIESAEDEKLTILNELKTQSALLVQQLQKKKPETILTMVETLIKTLHEVTVALSTGKGASCWLSLLWTIEGVYTFHPAWTGITDRLLNALTESDINQTTPLQTLMVLFPLLSQGIIHEAAGSASNSPHSVKDYVTRIQSLAFMLASAMFSQSEFIDPLIKGALASLSQASGPLPALLNLTSWSPAIFAGTKGDKAIKEAAPLMKGLQEPLIEQLKLLKKETKMVSSSAARRNMIISIQQSIIALKRINAPGLLEAQRSALNLLGMNTDTLQAASESLTTHALASLSAYYKAKEQREFTSFIRQAA